MVSPKPRPATTNAAVAAAVAGACVVHWVIAAKPAVASSAPTAVVVRSPIHRLAAPASGRAARVAPGPSIALSNAGLGRNHHAAPSAHTAVATASGLVAEPPPNNGSYTTPSR